jgi:hypothetical protein
LTVERQPDRFSEGLADKRDGTAGELARRRDLDDRELLEAVAEVQLQLDELALTFLGESPLVLASSNRTSPS